MSFTLPISRWVTWIHIQESNHENSYQDGQDCLRKEGPRTFLFSTRILVIQKHHIEPPPLHQAKLMGLLQRKHFSVRSTIQIMQSDTCCHELLLLLLYHIANHIKSLIEK